jgi:hypothetical protein
MTCRGCGGPVEWKGPISRLTHTECLNCGGINCQEIEDHGSSDGSVDEGAWLTPDLVKAVLRAGEDLSAPKGHGVGWP